MPNIPSPTFENFNTPYPNFKFGLSVTYQKLILTLAHNHAATIAKRCVDYLSLYPGLPRFLPDPYTICFGIYNEERYKEVLARFKIILRRLETQEIIYVRDDTYNDIRDSEGKLINKWIEAYVDGPWDRRIYICSKRYFKKIADGIVKNFESGWTPVPIVIHELAHRSWSRTNERPIIRMVGDETTEDIKFGLWTVPAGTKIYGLKDVSTLALFDPDQVIKVADSYSVFASLAVRATYKYDIGSIDFRNLLK